MICVILGIVFWNELFYLIFNVSFMFAVFEPSVFCSIVSFTVFLVFPEESLYASFRGLPGDVVLQYCFHEFFFFLINAWYTLSNKNPSA